MELINSNVTRGHTFKINPLPDDKFYSSKLIQFADDNFKIDENGRKLSKRVENTVGKGEIACYEQFLLFPQCFQKDCFPGTLKGVIVWEWLKEQLQSSIGTRMRCSCFSHIPAASASIHAFLSFIFTIQ